MKQREAAALIGVSRPFVAQILNRARQPSAETLAKISARLQLTDEEIGASVREMFPEPFAVADQPDAA